MSEPATLQPVLPSPSLAEEPGVPCERCGTFLQGKPRNVGVRRVCETCASLLRKQLRLYPTWYVSALGILINFTLAGALSAINWNRLGDRSRMRNALVITAAGVLWSMLIMARSYEVDDGLTGRMLSLVINLVATQVAAQALKPEYAQHVQQGGARANLLWPLLIGIGTIVAVGQAFDLLFLTPS
ncbi:MAG TPA: hypothetical protein VGB96_05585 [Archangium sp.]|jgi:hypothetical protein